MKSRGREQHTLARVGERIRVLRERKGWSQERLAAASDVHVTYLSGVERGRRNPTLLVLVRLARGLDVQITSLLSDQEGG